MTSVASRGRPSPSLAATLVAACSSGGRQPSTAPSRGGSVGRGLGRRGGAGELTIFAAASLKGVARQGEDGVRGGQPGDDAHDLDRLVVGARDADRAGRAGRRLPVRRHDQPAEARRRRASPSGDPVVFAGNKLTVIVADRQPGRRSRRPADLAKPGLKVIAAGDEVPITKYATQLVANLAKEAGYPADFADAYAANVVSKEDNVKAVVAKIELGEGDAGIVYVTDAEGVRQGRDGRGARRGQRPGDLRRRRRQGVPEPGRRREAFLDWFAGPDGQAILAELRVPAAAVMTEEFGAAAARSRGRHGRAEQGAATRRHPGGGVARAVAGLFALFLGLPVVVARRPVASSTGRSATAIATPVVLDALGLSLTTTAVSLVITVVARPAARVRAGAPPVPRQVAGRGGRRPADRPAAVGRRPRRCCSCSAGAGCSAAPLDAVGISIPFTTIAVVLAQTFVSAPFFIRSARTGLAGVDQRPRGRRPGRRRVRAPAVPDDHRAARRARRSPPAW